MIDAINNANDFLNNILFGVPMIIFILGTGLYLTIRLGFIQITKIKDNKEDVVTYGILFCLQRKKAGT